MRRYNFCWWRCKDESLLALRDGFCPRKSKHIVRIDCEDWVQWGWFAKRFYFVHLLKVLMAFIRYFGQGLSKNIIRALGAIFKIHNFSYPLFGPNFLMWQEWHTNLKKMTPPPFVSCVNLWQPGSNYHNFILLSQNSLHNPFLHYPHLCYLNPSFIAFHNPTNVEIVLQRIILPICGYRGPLWLTLS